MTLNLVEDFIAKRLNEYVEPQFLGNPKRTSRTYGYSKERYAAYLYLALTSLSGDQIGRRIGTSASLVRKWHAEGKSQMLNLMMNELDFLADYAYREINGAILTSQPFHFGDVCIWSSSAASRIMRAIRRNSGNPPGPPFYTLRAALKEIEKDLPGDQTKFPKKSEKLIKGMDTLARYETNPQVELRQILGFLNEHLHKWIVGVLSDTHSRKGDRAMADRIIRTLLTQREDVQ